MRRGTSTLIAFVVACAAAAVPQPAQARSSLDAKAARMSDEAAAHFKAGRYLEAAERFEQAYALNADVIVRLRNAGRAWEEAGRPERALHCFERYLAKETDPKLRADAEERIEKARAAVAAARKAEQPAVDAATPAAPAASSTAPRADVTASSGGVPSWSLPLAASIGSVGLFLTGVAVRQKVEDAASNFELHDAAGHYDYPGGAGKRDEDASTIAQNRGLAWGLVGGGVVLAGVATWLWLRDGDAESDGKTEQAGVRLLPVAAGSNAGLVLSGRF
ncbi:MAG: tetratricopeptide repeat protein [Deltaproteobacteria bacterium]|nr:tetratricopeptide repeat protein [Deltaproteobacteria bacterium]